MKGISIGGIENQDYEFGEIFDNRPRAELIYGLFS